MKPGVNKKTGLILAVLLVAVSIAAVYFFNQTNSSQPLVKLPAFQLADVEGKTFHLSSTTAKPRVIHFMVVGCGGDFNPLNDDRLRSLLEIREKMGDDVEIVTVLVTTCATTDLVLLKNWYNVTWTFGNDYDDFKLDILEAFKSYELTDGSMILGNSKNQFMELIRDEISIESLMDKLEALLA